MPKKKFRLFDAVLMAVVIILVVESVAPATAIGPSQFFWWIFLLLFFFVPYGLISSELGASYTGEGGVYDWVKLAFGSRWGGRLAWLYWVNYPIWMSSLAILFASVVRQVFELRLDGGVTILIELLFVWVIVIVGNRSVSESKWIMNLAAIAKIFIILSLTVLGIHTMLTHGLANQITLQTVLPQFNLSSMSNLSVVIFNFLGFEVVATMADQMDHPNIQIPKAIIYGGILIAVFYLLAAFGVGAAIPADQLSSSTGLIDAFKLLIGQHGNWFIIVIGIFFLYTLISEMISWALGINYVADFAAKDTVLPKVFGYENKQNMPVGTGYINGIVATVMILLATIIKNQDIFWAFFSLNVVALLLSYAMLFPAFLALRKSDPQTARPFKVPGGKVVIQLMAWIPEVLLIVTVILTVVPMNASSSEISGKLPVMIGTIITLVIGEIVVRTTEYRANKIGEIDHENIK